MSIPELELDQLGGGQRDAIQAGPEVHQHGGVALEAGDRAKTVSIMADPIMDQKCSPRSGGIMLIVEGAGGQDAATSDLVPHTY